MLRDGLPGSPSSLLRPLRRGDSVVGKPREWAPNYDRHTARLPGMRIRIFFLDSWLYQAYIPVVVFWGDGRGASSFAEASAGQPALAKALADKPAGILAWAGLLGEASAKGVLPAVALAKAGRNVYFCFGKKYS